MVPLPAEEEEEPHFSSENQSLRVSYYCLVGAAMPSSRVEIVSFPSPSPCIEVTLQNKVGTNVFKEISASEQ